MRAAALEEKRRRGSKPKRPRGPFAIQWLGTHAKRVITTATEDRVEVVPIPEEQQFVVHDLSDVRPRWLAREVARRLTESGRR